MESPDETNFTAKLQQRITYGETLPNGSILDLVDTGDRDGLSLLFWDGKEPLIRPVIEYGGVSYRPPNLHPSIRAALRFPRGASKYGATRDLFMKIVNALGEHLGLPEDYAAFATCWILTSWVLERIVVPPTLCVRGELGQLCNAMRMFTALCRRALLVAELSRRLPFLLRPTLLVNDPVLSESEVDCAFWRTAGCDGMFVAGTENTVCSLRCAKAVVLRGDESPAMWGSEAMFVILPHSELPSLSDQLLADIAAEFQPQLEMFRLRLLSGADPFVSKSHPLSKFELVRNLGACIPEDAEIVRVLTSLLQLHQEQLLARRSCDPWVASLQAVWTPSHKQKEMAVAEITTRVNATLRSLDDLYEYNVKEIGWKLRNLKLSTTSNGQRKVLRFSGENRSRIHQCFREFGLQLPFFDDCPDCKRLQATEVKPVE